MSALVPSTPPVVLSREEKIRPEPRQLSPSCRFNQMLTSHPSYQQEFGGKKHTRRETRLMDLAGMTAADLSYSMGSERAQSAFWQFGRLFSANNDGADEREISWVSKYMTLRTLLPVAVVIIGGLFTFLTCAQCVPSAKLFARSVHGTRSGRGWEAAADVPWPFV